jgi:hypothetical protein
MESRAWPVGAVGVLALPVAQAGMILTEFWKARTLHRSVAAKPLTTALLRGARPYFSIRPRANNTASGDALVALHVRLWSTAAAGVAGAHVLPQLPPALAAVAPSCDGAPGVDWTVLEAGIDATWSPRWVPCWDGGRRNGLQARSGDAAVPWGNGSRAAAHLSVAKMVASPSLSHPPCMCKLTGATPSQR